MNEQANVQPEEVDIIVDIGDALFEYHTISPSESEDYSHILYSAKPSFDEDHLKRAQKIIGDLNITQYVQECNSFDMAIKEVTQGLNGSREVQHLDVTDALDYMKKKKHHFVIYSKIQES